MVQSTFVKTKSVKQNPFLALRHKLPSSANPDTDFTTQHRLSLSSKADKFAQFSVFLYLENGTVLFIGLDNTVSSKV